MDTPVGQVISGLTHVFTTSSEPWCLAFLFAALTTNQRDISRICVKGRYQTRLGQGFCCPYTHTPSSGWTRSGNRQEGAQCWDGAHWQSLAPPSKIHICLVGISVTAALLTLLYHFAGLPAVVTNQSRVEKVCLWVPFLCHRNSCMKESHLCGRQTESMGVTSVVLYLVHGTECPFSNFVSWVEVPCCCLQLFIQYDTTHSLLMQIKKICWAWHRQLLDFLRTAAKQNEERGNLQK